MKPAQSIPVQWRGRRVHATVPHPLGSQDLSVSERTLTACITTSARLAVAAESMPAEFSAATRLTLRNEGVASSHIEGVRAPMVDVVLPQAAGHAMSVAAHFSAIEHMLAHIDAPLTVETLLGWHSVVMDSTPLAKELVGTIRTEQGWIGGTSPVDAAVVTPPPDQVPGLLVDLVEFANRTDGDPVLQAAVAHAQFELIHPFADGNGRVGRMLVAWVLARRLGLVSPPAVSAAIAHDIGGYTSGLALYSLGRLDEWCTWFASIVTKASQQQVTLVQRLESLLAQWRTQLLAPQKLRALRNDSSAWDILKLVPVLITLTADNVSRELAVSPRSALTSLDRLAEEGILEDHVRAFGRGRPQRFFVSPEVLHLISAGR